MPTVSRSAGGPLGSAVADTYLTETRGEECLQRDPRGLACHTGASCRPHPGSPSSSSSSPLGSRAGLGRGEHPAGAGEADEALTPVSRPPSEKRQAGAVSPCLGLLGCGPEPPHTVRKCECGGGDVGWWGGVGSLSRTGHPRVYGRAWRAGCPQEHRGALSPLLGNPTAKFGRRWRGWGDAATPHSLRCSSRTAGPHVPEARFTTVPTPPQRSERQAP